ncbi:hypothetical protein Tsubulata_038432 [Turnera subulata]|uniref:Uncharacterized protein n=1 Tax=Turnera subulata TaxID=218843 RepID=A0A9Q0EXX6_9ROSI|nr:hypothetical protein Tsubulata_038432 [Turnera subulata]
MALPYTGTQNSSLTQTPLIETQEHNHTQLSKSLTRLETFLRIFGFCQYSAFSITVSWVVFLLLGIVLPVLSIHFSYCINCEKYQISIFEVEVLVFECLAAAISLLCISHNLRKYGVRKFLFVDRYHGHLSQFDDEYAKKIKEFFRLVVAWALPFLLVKTAREVVRVLYVPHDSWWQAVAIPIALIVSWIYSTVIFISGCALFNLVCNLQVLHFENYGKLLERDLDVSVYIEEHIRLTHHLSKISHRFRLFFIFELLTITASQVVALFETTGNSGIITLINGGDFVVSSVLELVGLVICLHAAAKTSHRAQSVASVATKWHSLVTCSSSDNSQAGSNHNGGEVDNPGLLRINYSESDLESVDYIPMPTNAQLTSYTFSYHKRQAFGMYLISKFTEVS